MEACIITTPLENSKLWHQQARCCSLSFKNSKVHYLQNSLSTEELLPVICIVRHIKTYASPSRTNYQGCSWGVVLLHDNKCSHLSTVTHAEQVKFKREQLDHPLYSPDMSPCNFHEFSLLKKHLKGQRFNLDNKLKDNVKDWVLSRPQEFQEHEILQFANQQECYAQAYDAYFE